MTIPSNPDRYGSFYIGLQFPPLASASQSFANGVKEWREYSGAMSYLRLGAHAMARDAAE
nr:hypothetical protein [uncultured Rhodoferax sp.]